MNFTVIKAIFKRDFVSYFSNPTGYVFICVFVVLSALAAFWPPEFFSNNLANLDQLNKWLPFIMLVFIPAITMSIWAEERRQGTDELLLTLPAGDIDVVVGKYLAAVAIYTVSLLFSMFAIWLVFSWGLGSPDVGLFVGSYAGYWFIGLAMLSIGMVASFLTNNLTVGFILGMIFNLPLALFGVADWIIKDPELAQGIKRWSAVEQFGDFQRGVISLSGISYFVLISVVMLYVSMVLISRRHWTGRDDGGTMWAHYLTRTIALLLVAVGVNLFLSHHNALHVDITSQGLNSLSDRTVKLVHELRDNPDVKTIRIDAYVSPQVPAEYAPHKLNLLSTLSELSALSGGKIVVDVHQIENFSEAATLAERTYGIEPHSVATINRGVRGNEEVFFGVAFSSGLDKVVIPFVDRGIPVEYELVRSICTVAGQQRRTLGVLKTDAQLFGGFSMQGPTEESQIITELKKQYDVSEVDPSKPITKKYDVLLAVQPSSLTPEAMTNFVECVKSGQPTAIFEDPMPWLNSFGGVVGTGQPKQPPGGMMAMFGGQQPPEPKGDISQLWKLLGVKFDPDSIIWQDFNPETKLGDIPKEWIFIDDGLKAQNAIDPFNPLDPVSAGMKQVLFLVGGAWQPEKGSKLKFTELAHTGPNTGSITYRDYEMWNRSGGTIQPRRSLTHDQYIVAARVAGHRGGRCRPVRIRHQGQRGRAEGCRQRTRPRRRSDQSLEHRRGELAEASGRFHQGNRPRREPQPGRPQEAQHRRDPRLRHRLDRADHLPAPRDGQKPRHARRLEVPERAVRLEHSRLARRRRPLHRHSQADPLASAAHEGRRGHRGVSVQVARRTQQVHRRIERNKSKRCGNSSATRSPNWRTAPISTPAPRRSASRCSGSTSSGSATCKSPGSRSSATKKSSRATANWRPKSKACRISTSSAPWFCRRFRRSCLHFSSSSTAAAPSKKASTPAACATAKRNQQHRY